MSPQPTQTDSPVDPTSVFSQRSMKQLGIFFAGAGFLALSTVVTRRSVARKQIAAFPKFYQPSNQPAAKAEGADSPLVALEALNLATLNVMSFFLMLGGGAAWSMDISSIDDLRKMVRRHIGPPGGQTDEALEQEVEEWVATVLRRKELRELDGKSKPSGGA